MDPLIEQKKELYISCFRSVQKNHLKGWLNHRSWLHPTVSAIVGLGWCHKIDIPNKLPGDTGAAGLGAVLVESLV